MDINKSFYVETTTDGKTKIYNVGARFFAGNGKSGGIMQRFNASEVSAKNAYITQLKKDGWLPLSLEDIKKTGVNELGIITAYPFKHKKGYVTNERIEAIAREKGHTWDRADHFTNPFSALTDYQVFVYNLNYDELKHPVFAMMDKLESIGAIETIENFFKEVNFIPDPRRFNKTTKELWRYYREHLKECCRIVANEHFALDGEKFIIGDLIINMNEIKPLWDLVSEEAYERRIASGTKNS